MNKLTNNMSNSNFNNTHRLTINMARRRKNKETLPKNTATLPKNTATLPKNTATLPKNTGPTPKRIRLAPQEELSKDIIAKLSAINASARKKDFAAYKRDIQNFFCTKNTAITKELNFYMAGFIEGEGSISLSAKKMENAQFGFVIDPVFNLTQHVNGIQLLFDAMSILNAGRIRYKAQSNATLVLIIDNRQTLEEKVIPFLEKYSHLYGSVPKKERLALFKQGLNLIKSGAHLDLDRYCYELLPVWDAMRVQRGQKRQTFANLEEAQNYARTFVRPISTTTRRR